MSHNCPITGCSASIADDKLMCLAHWKMVPSKLQAAVTGGWRDIRRAGLSEKRLRAVRRYNEARMAAIESVTLQAPVA